jgi:magnesium-dependent phosphatase 1
MAATHLSSTQFSSQKADGLFIFRPFWVDTHVMPPLKATGKYNSVKDADGDDWHFYPHVPEILHTLKKKGITVVAASRTHAPELASQMLSLLMLDPAHVDGEEGMKGIDYFDEFEIYPGRKTTHFRSIQEKTGIEFSEMLFFDDEARNKEVQKELGVLMMLVPKGVSMSSFDRGVREWRKRRGEGQ